MFDLIIEVRSFWHAGVSRGKGSALDMVVHRDGDGCPCLPGRTVRGLVRDAVRRAEVWKRVSAGLTHALFGTDSADIELTRPDMKAEDFTRFDTEPGALAFADACLPRELTAWVACQDAALGQGFFREIFSTKIDRVSGSAENKTLRGMEVAIPMTLTSHVALLPHADLDQRVPGWLADLRRCLPLIRGLGLGRTRGLGRCVVKLEEVAS